MSDNQSPTIEDISWGEVVTAEGSFKDAKLWPGGARAWDWKESGTDHTPGIQPADVKELVAGGATIVILSCGQNGRLGIMDATTEYLTKENVAYEIHKTPRAAERYNELAREGKPVGALIHSTC